MSRAKKVMEAFALCSHISKCFHDFFHRAKPATEVQRSGTEVAPCGLEVVYCALPSCVLPSS